jgi:hypothetical protein
MAENKTYTSLSMDRDEPIGNYPVGDRRALAVHSIQMGVPPDYDNGTVTRPNNTTEVYSFFKGATLLRTITLVYTNANKKDLASWSIS